MLFYFINEKASLFLLLAAEEFDARRSLWGGGVGTVGPSMKLMSCRTWAPPSFVIHQLDSLGQVPSLCYSMYPSVKWEL